MKIQCSSQRRRREEGKAFVFDHQHGCRDITCKPAINKSRYGLLGYASTAHVLVASFLMLSINLLSDFRGYKQDEESVVLCIHGFPTSNYDWSKVGGPLCLYEPVNAKSPLPPRYLTGVFFCTAGNLTQNEACPVRHWLSFQNADQHCKQKDFVIFSAFCMKRCVQRSLLLYSLICWSIWEPLKKPIKCWLCGMNNFKGGYYHILLALSQ